MFSATLTKSSARREPRGSGSARVSASAATPIGILTAKSQGQFATARIAAPMEGPAAPPSATVTATAPMIVPSSRCGKVKRISATVSDMMAPPPSPCRNRAPASQGKDGDRAQSPEASVNTTTPSVKTRR